MNAKPIEDPRLDELLHRWEELREKGLAPDAEQLCRDTPELQEELVRSLHLLEGWGRLNPESTRCVVSLEYEPSNIGLSTLPQIKTMLRQVPGGLKPVQSIFSEGDRYTIVGTLGSGGMGHVYLADDHDLGRQVAIKVMKDGGGDDSFIREARLTAQLSHPNVLPIYDLGARSDSEISITMPRMRGTDLKETLGKWSGEERLTRLPELVDILLKVCDAVEYAHSRGVVHQDIKPSNVMVGDFGEVYLIDWGLATSIHDDEDWRRVGRSSIGTPAYIAPEQVHPRGKKDIRVDVFGLGAILYETLFDRPPNSGASFRKVLPAKVLPVSDFESTKWPVPRGLVDVCRKALAFNPDDRYPSAEAMSLAIAEAREKHLRGASSRVILGLMVGVAAFTLSMTGLVSSFAGWSSIHWAFWASWGSCALGLMGATMIEATGVDAPLRRPRLSQPKMGRAAVMQTGDSPRVLDPGMN